MGWIDSICQSVKFDNKSKVSLHVKDKSDPIFESKRPAPFAIIETVNKKLDWLKNLGVISPVEFSSWAVPIVIVKKKVLESYGLCADFSTGLNDMLVHHKYPLPTPKEVSTKLNRGNIFSDILIRYIPLSRSEGSKKFLTIHTHTKVCFLITNYHLV